MLFESIIKSKYFDETHSIIIFDKVDVFRQKLSTGFAPLNKYYPDYQGRATDTFAAQRFFANKFEGFTKPNQKFHVEYTNKIDVHLVKRIMTCVSDAKIDILLLESGFF